MGIPKLAALIEPDVESPLDGRPATKDFTKPNLENM